LRAHLVASPASSLEADQSGSKSRGRHVRGKRQANCARQCDAVILNLGNSLLSQHEGGLASLEELLPVFGQYQLPSLSGAQAGRSGSAPAPIAGARGGLRDTRRAFGEASPPACTMRINSASPSKSLNVFMFHLWNVTTTNIKPPKSSFHLHLPGEQ